MNQSSNATEIIPDLTGEFNTQALVNNQGYTYNQANFTYNEIGVEYGGIYNYGEDIIPTVSLSHNPIPDILSDNLVISFNSHYASITPSIYAITDISTHFVPFHLLGQPIGPGFLMFITYPS